jgi:hypothetical protein
VLQEETKRGKNNPAGNGDAMKKIVLLSDRSEAEAGLIHLMGLLFPECEVEVFSLCHDITDDLSETVKQGVKWPQMKE